MNMIDHMDVTEGICQFRPRGESSLAEVVDLISEAIAFCRDRHIDKLLIVLNGLVGVSIPTLLDRFLMAEEWAQRAAGMVVAAIVVRPEYIHPEKFGVKAAADFGLVLDMFTTEADAMTWLSEYRAPG